MADPFVAEVRVFPFNFAPRGWAFCDGQLMPLAQNTALFALLGTMYGGNGQSNFALPDLQGRSPMQPGEGPGLSPRDIGESGGEETVTLTAAQMPGHTHEVRASSQPGEDAAPAGAVLGRSVGASLYQTDPGASAVQMAPQALAAAGGGQPHNNRQPYLTVNFCIALQGVFPPRW